MIGYAVICLLQVTHFCLSAVSPEITKPLSRSEHSGVDFAYFEKHESRRLSGPSGRNSTTFEDSIMKCGMACVRLPWCVSYNFKKIIGQHGKHICESLSFSKYNNSNSLRHDPQFHHFGVVSPCTNSPCRNGGSCITLVDLTFTCVCASGFEGKLCQKQVFIGCPNDWSQIEESCYKVSSHGAVWESARAACRARGADLAIIDSANKSHAVYQIIRQRAWIGLHRDPKNLSTWLWVNGRRPSYTNWLPGEPNGFKDGLALESCVHLHEAIGWNDRRCNASFFYICEKSEKVTLFSSCADIYKRIENPVDKAYWLQVGADKLRVFCHMTDIPGCGEGGWTLVMKINGSESTFEYNSNYWSNKASYDLLGGTTGLDSSETKLPTYWATAFTKICLGMKDGYITNFISIKERATSLHSLIADGQFRETSLGRNVWQSLLRKNVLQPNCNREGFNAKTNRNRRRARIGIFANNQNDCDTCDTCIGIGTRRHSCHPQMGYIFVQ